MAQPGASQTTTLRDMREQETGGRTPRKLPYVGFAAIAVAYLAIIQLGGRLATAVFDTDDGFTTTRDVMVNMWIPLGAAFLFTYGVIAWLGWWRPVLREERRLRRWAWAVPIILAVCILIAIDYADLADKGLGFVLALFIATQFVGWGEEGMFRGVGVTMLREHGLTEGKVALVQPDLRLGPPHQRARHRRSRDPAGDRGQLRRLLLLPDPPGLRR